MHAAPIDQASNSKGLTRNSRSASSPVMYHMAGQASAKPSPTVYRYVGAKGNPNPDLANALPHGERHHTVNPDRCERGERRGERRQHPRGTVADSFNCAAMLPR